MNNSNKPVTVSDVFPTKKLPTKPGRPTVLPEPAKQPERGEEPSPQRAVVKENSEFRSLKTDLLCEFFELAIHSILYYRQLYPQSFFERRTKYQIPVWVAVHPAIREYVENCVVGIKPPLLLRRIDALLLVILDPVEKTPVERFVFRILDEKGRGRGGGQNDFAGDAFEETVVLPPNRDKFIFKLGEALKAFTLRIAACKSYLKPLPPDCSCVLQIVTDSTTQLAMQEDGDESRRFPWVEADDREAKATEEGRVQSVRGPTADVCPLEIYVDEARNKFIPIFRNIEPATENDNL